MVDVKEITRHIISLPALPSIVAKLLELIDNPNTSASGLARLISSDQALTARILKLANSSYYAFANQIKTVQLAISLLGFNTITNLAIGLTLTKRFNTEYRDDDFDRMRFWEHCLSVAVVGKRFSEEMKLGIPTEIFTIGILHDIGKLVIHEYLHPRYLEIEKRTRDNGVTSRTAEIEVIGVDHTQIGTWLCQSWKLPVDIENAVGFHHEPDKDPSVETALIHFADGIVNCIGYSSPSVRHNVDEISTNALERLGLPVKEGQKFDWDRYLDIAKDEIERAGEFISILNVV